MRPAKYRNVRVSWRGDNFDSRKEMRHWLLLQAMQEEGRISGLRRQVRYELLPAIWREEQVRLKTKTKTVRRSVQKAVYYVADFVYTDNATGKEVVADTKSAITRIDKVYVKKKMMLALLGIEIREM